MRDYFNFDTYYDELLEDVYSQPSDFGHLSASNEIIVRWILPLGISSVLDVGCGEGDAEDIFYFNDIQYMGVAIGDDVKVAKKNHRSVEEEDFNFLDGYSADMVFSRHSLEHSPFPLITLMEWHRISSKYLCIVLPNPEHYTYIGKNHYSVMTSHHAGWLLRRAGWKTMKFHMDKEEIWFLCEKKPRIGYEGWAKVPLSEKLHKFEREVYATGGEFDVTKPLGELE